MSKKTIETNKHHVRASFQPGTFDEDSRTVEVVWSTGAKGKRGYYNPYYEELSMQKKHIRLERLNAGAPVLNNHSSYDLRDSIGVVEKAWIKEKQGLAKIRFSSREEVQDIVKDIQEGIIRNISVGYKVHEYTDVSKKDDEIQTLRATDWEPMEISFVNMPFDKDSQVRSENQDNEEKFKTVIIENKEIEMGKKVTETRDVETTNQDDLNSSLETKVQPEDNSTEETRTTETEVETQPATESNESETETQEETTVERSADDIAKDEKVRGVEIRKAVSTAGLDEAFAAELIEKDVKLDDARKLVLERMAEKNQVTKTNNHRVEVNDVDNKQLRIEAATNALLHRSSGGTVELKNESREYRGMSLIRMAESVLTTQNVSVKGLTQNEIAERALHHTSDFVEILANVANKTLRAGYESQPQTFEPFVRSVSVNDFKEISRTQLSDAPSLEKVNEAGEYKHGKMSEAAEKYRVETYGKIVGVTRQTLVNDDLDAFSRLPSLFGASAKDLETELIYKELASNPIMSDGNALFSAAHGNIAVGGDVGAIGVNTVAAGRLAMRLQKGLTEKLIRVRPEYLLTPAALETAAEQFLGPIVPNNDGDVNPFKSKLGLVSEAELDAYSATAWYMMAMKQRIDMFEIARLTGQEGPTLSSKVGFEVDGVKFKVSYDFGVKAIDWRGMYLNPGA